MRRFLLAPLIVFACSVEEAVETAAPPPVVPAKDAITKTTENGPVKASVKVWPAKPTLGDSIYVRLEIEAPAGVSIDAPFQEAGDQKLGRFRVVGFTRDTHRTASGGQLQEQTYTLEAQSSGRDRVPPLRLEMLDARGSADKAKPQELLTDEIPLEIGPVPTETAAAPLKPALGEMEPDVGGTSWTVILGIASLIAVLGSGSILLVRGFRARRRIEQQRSAYDEAVAQLRALEARGAPGADDADAWFVELSAIVRRYLEFRFDIRAPELTTEEFLLVATARPELGQTGGDPAGSREPRSPGGGGGRAPGTPHRDMLSAFLESCDRVKFAGYRPDAEESLATLEAARGFIDDTRLREPIARAA